MRTISCSEFRRNLAAALDSVAEDRTPILITRERRKPAAVLMPLDDYASLEETRDLLRSPRNRERLLKAVDELAAGQGKERDLLA